MTPRKVGFLKGFAFGFAVLAIANGLQVSKDGLATLSNFGVWINVGVQCLIAGIIVGAILGAMAARKTPPAKP